MASPAEITVSQLARLIGTPNCPVIVDICIDEDFEADPRFIPTAFRHPFTDIEALVPKLKGKKTVLTCQRGIKLSQGGAALLRSYGCEVEYLEGGNFGWRDSGLPLVPASAIPKRREDGHTLWVTRHRPKIDRIACPWLIRRFIDPGARFLFVSPDWVGGVADRYGATPFDVEDVFWSHRGENCTFDTMLDEFKLHTEPLDRLAGIIRAADTDRHNLAPEASGLLALSVGLSRLYKNDLQQLEAGIGMYDALYRWARDGFEEKHDWPHHKSASGRSA